MAELTGKVAVITGAASGIGRATAVRFARAGARLAICDVNAGPCQALAEEIAAGNEGNAPLVAQVDVGVSAEVRDFFIEVDRAFGSLDVLVNNAGMGGDGALFPDLREEIWDRIMAVNLNGHFYAARGAVPLMMRRAGGSIVNIASVLAEATLKGCVPYSTSKAAIVGFTKALANDLGQHNIRVNCLIPGSTDTAMMWRNVPADQINAVRAEVAAAQLLGRYGAPEELAEAALFLASDRSSYITGTTLAVDGGLLARLATTR